MDAPQEPRWLDAEERQAWLALASTLNRLPAALVIQTHRSPRTTIASACSLVAGMMSSA